MTQIIDSRKLLAFITLTQVGSFTAAARELNLTQSAISHAIAGLERDLGTRLFNRLGRTVTITASGTKLLEHTNVIMNEMKLARENLAALKTAKE
ncbi:transcriptional regulator [Opitutaceae bacterium TAV1]|nr:LysR family transcriptional regulator [Opitutaceae bacterium TAV5]EIQ01759.1 transcriptional regulator [Opitutaceae bacterium TAV1]